MNRARHSKKKDWLHSLPIPLFDRVKECHQHADGVTYVVPEISPGTKNYNVVRINLETGKISCIGRQLALHLARKVAARPSSEDGRALA